MRELVVRKIVLPEFLEKQAAEIVREAITHGTPKFQNGDAEGCFRSYLDATNALIGVLNGYEASKLFTSALKVVIHQDASAASWTLRNIFEAFIFLLSPSFRPSYIDLHSASKNGLLEQVEIQSNISCLVNEFDLVRLPSFLLLSFFFSLLL